MNNNTECVQESETYSIQLVLKLAAIACRELRAEWDTGTTESIREAHDNLCVAMAHVQEEWDK